MPILERKIIHDRTTLCSRILSPRFVLPRHKHAEYEIMLFTGGSGKQFVGEGVCDYKEGDIAMIGSNVPHLHLCNAKLNPTMGLEASAGVALQFHPTIFPMSMEKLPDYLPIYGLLQKSQYGIRFYDKNLYEELLQRFQELERVEHTARLIHFFQIIIRKTKCFDFWERNVLFPKTKRSFF
ncbi:AraC family ligand binding domain-containing protein, partial [Parabacteroides merdae]